MARERKDDDMAALAGFQDLLALRKGYDEAVDIYWRLRENKIFRNLVVENLSEIRPEFRLYQINPGKLNPDSQQHLSELKDLSQEQKQEFYKKQDRIRDTKAAPSFPGTPGGPGGTGDPGLFTPRPEASAPSIAAVAPSVERKGSDYQLAARKLMGLEDDPLTPEVVDFIRGLQKFISADEIMNAIYHPDNLSRVAKIELLFLNKDFVDLVNSYPVVSKLFVANYVHDIDQSKDLFRGLKLREKAETAVDRPPASPGGPVRS